MEGGNWEAFRCVALHVGALRNRSSPCKEHGHYALVLLLGPIGLVAFWGLAPSPPSALGLFVSAFFCWAGVALSCAPARLLLLPFPGEVLWLVAVLGCLVVPLVGGLPPPLVGRRSSAPPPSAPALYYPGALLLTASA
jgi:hypothetical protein